MIVFYLTTFTAGANVFSGFVDLDGSLTGVFYAILTLAIGIAVSFVLASVTKRIFVFLGKQKMNDSKRFNTYATVASAVVRFLILFFTAIQTLGFLGLQSTINSVFATVGVGTIVITISLQSLIRDISVGFFMLIENEFSVGDYVAIGPLSGRVEEFNLRTTTLRADTGELHVFPNSSIAAATNYSKGKFQAGVDISFSAECDPFRTMDLLQAGVKEAFPGRHAVVQPALTMNADSYSVRVLCDCPHGRKSETEQEILACVIRTMAKEGIKMAGGKVPVVGSAKDA